MVAKTKNIFFPKMKPGFLFLKFRKKEETLDEDITNHSSGFNYIGLSNRPLYLGAGFSSKKFPSILPNPGSCTPRSIDPIQGRKCPNSDP
jgi:hypothetical protein